MLTWRWLCVLLLFAFHTSMAAESLRVYSQCSEHNWNLLFRPLGRPYQVNAAGEKVFLPWQEPHQAILEVRRNGTRFDVTEVIWGKPPASNSLELKSLHRLLRIYSNEEALQFYAQAPRLDEPVQWEYLPGEGRNDWFGKIHQASINSSMLKIIRAPESLDATRYLFMIYHFNDGRWGFRLQGICDLLLVEHDKVYAPIYLKDQTPKLVWMRHPLGDSPGELKKFLVYTARSVSERITVPNHSMAGD